MDDNGSEAENSSCATTALPLTTLRQAPGNAEGGIRCPNVENGFTELNAYQNCAGFGGYGVPTLLYMPWSASADLEHQETLNEAEKQNED